jgi:transcription antitermination protein NusB
MNHRGNLIRSSSCKCLNELIIVSESLDQVLEERSIYWNDDLEFTVHMVEKSLKKYSGPDGESIPVYSLFKDEEDSEFVTKLFHNIVMHHEEYEKLIDQHTRNWDVERIAYMDILIMELAIAEILENESIPTKVTLMNILRLQNITALRKAAIL